jgi:hypothetical protein
LVEADTRLPYLQDQRNSYVQITRARDAIKIFTDDDQALRDIAGILSGKRDTLDLKADLEEAKRMEAKLSELARKESPMLREAEDYGKTAAEAIERAAGAPVEPVVPSSPPTQAHRTDDPAPRDEAPQSQESQPVQASEPLDFSSRKSSVTPEPENFKTRWSAPVRIENKKLLSLVEGRNQLEDRIRATMKNIENCINARQDLVPMDKQALAKFFNDPAAVDLILEAPKPETAVLGAEVALEIRTKEGACSRLPTDEVREVRHFIRLAASALAESRAPKPPPQKGLEFDGGFEL